MITRLGLLIVAGLAVAVAAGVARADAPRPANAGTGEVLAKVHLVGGAGVRIKATVGTPFLPKPTMGLLRTDTVVVPPNEFVIVHLTSNNHLVRIDDDVSLRVSDIVLLHAPRTSESLSTQLDRMVSTEEKRVAERIAGTYAGRSAGEAAPPETGGGGGGSAEGKAEGKLSRKSRGDGVMAERESAPPPKSAPRTTAAAPPAPTPAPPPPAPPPAAAAAPAPAPAPAQRGVVAESSFERSADKPGAGKVGAGRASDSLVDTRAAKPTLPIAELRLCLDRELARAKLPRLPITLRLRIEGGRIRRVAIVGGLMTPECVSRLLLDRPYVGADQSWQNVDLPAK